MPNNASALMTLEEVCRYVRCGRDTLMSYVRANQFVQPTRIGRRYMFERAAVVAFFRSVAAVADAEKAVYDMLHDISIDRNRSDHDRLAAVRNLNLLVRGELDVEGLLAQVNESGK